VELSEKKLARISWKWGRGQYFDYSPYLKLRAIEQLIVAYKSVGDFEKAKDLTEKGLEFLKEVSVGDSRYKLELYLELGREFTRRREFDRAVDAFSRSLSELGERPAWRAGGKRLENARTIYIGNQVELGNAYFQSGKSREALKQYQAALDSIREWTLDYAYEADLYAGMGEVYLQEKKFSQALGYFQKALTLAESEQQSAAISSASRRIGDALRQTNRVVVAVPYYEKAIQQIESARSLLKSEEYRQSFFEGGLEVYVSLIGVLTESGKAEEAFGYSERARSRAFLDLVGNKTQLSRAKSKLSDEERSLQERCLRSR
jgi:tetratricopeptide (TPR) repeat protein